MKTLPNHLGGHSNINHIDSGVLKYIKECFDTSSLLDIGCGLGEMKELCDDLGMSYLGIDGDFTANRKHEQVLIHDYTEGPSNIDKTFDVAWSTEFVEHVEEKYVDNFMADFKKAKFVMVTHAPPGKYGYHHVNCKSAQYWIDVFKKNDFEFSYPHTELIRKSSTMEKEFVRNNGLFFIHK